MKSPGQKGMIRRGIASFITVLLMVAGTVAAAAGGTIAGTVTGAGTGVPISEGWVSIYDVRGNYLGAALLDDAGRYFSTDLEPGTYYARTDSSGLFDQLWEGLPCAQDDCVVTSGTPIVVTASETLVDFALKPGGTIAGTVTAIDTGRPVVDGWVSIYDSLGSYLGLALLDEAGRYSYRGLAPGTYYARTDSSGFYDELWGDIPCARGRCRITSGSPITVTTGAATADFALQLGSKIMGTVTVAQTRRPITYGWVSIYGASGEYLGMAVLDAKGRYSFGGLELGTFFARTDSTGFLDELWQDISCAQNDCVVTSGTPILVTAGVATADFVLEAREGSLIFSDGFEAGSSSAWSRVMGELP